MRRWIASLLTLFVLGLAIPSFAAGSVKLSKTTVDEDNKGRWKLKFTINYGKKPHIGHIPMVFSFKQTAVYERYVDDKTGNTPATRTVPVRNAEPQHLPVDVGFANAKGELFQTTKFSIKLSRDNDFEAGEYELTVKESQSGRKIGGKIRIKLTGRNKVVNRGAMDFSSKKPSKPKPDPEPTSEDVPKDDEEPKAAEDMGPDLSDIPDVADDDEEGPGKVPPKQGGCGCELVGMNAPRAGWASVLLLGLCVMRRRRRA